MSLQNFVKGLSSLCSLTEEQRLVYFWQPPYSLMNTNKRTSGFACRDTIMAAKFVQTCQKSIKQLRIDVFIVY